MEDFLLSKEIEGGCSPRTVKAYQYDLRMFIQIVGDLPITSVRTLHIRKFLKYLHEAGYTKSGLARKIACIKSFFKFAEENELVEKNPTRAIKSPKIRPEEMLPKYLTREEIQEIFTFLFSDRLNSSLPYYSRQRLKIIIPLLYATMARISEICALNISDVNLHEGFIKVLGKGNKERYIPLDTFTRSLLSKYIEARCLQVGPQEDGPLFINSRGHRLTPKIVEKDIALLKNALGWDEHKKLTPHIFRHTGATHLRQNGMDISELQDLLGHSSPQTTRIYAKNDIGTLAKSYSKYHPLAQGRIGRNSS